MHNAYHDKEFLHSLSEIMNIKITHLYNNESPLPQTKNIMKEIQNTLIRGVENITSTSQEKMIKSYIDKDGSIKQKNIYFILTSGSNLVEVLNLDFVDETRTQTSSIIETNDIYGIDISRDKIVYELSSTMGISKIHSSVYADEMTYIGELTPIQRTGVQKRDPNNVFLQMLSRTG